MQNKNINKIKNLFLQQSYLDSWEDYTKSLSKSSFIVWDYIVLTASNDEQARGYREQINKRLNRGLLPRATKYIVLPDPDGKRVGSGGATFNVIRHIYELENQKVGCFEGKRILIIHSGGDSKRVPQYSAIGKLFSPVPRELPNGLVSTLFDEFIIGMSGIPSRIEEGMMILSGDVLLLYNPLQIDGIINGAAAISIKEPALIGKNHGVFLNDGNNKVKRFLHKQTIQSLESHGAIDVNGDVDLDTGAVLLDVEIINVLLSLIISGGNIDKYKYDSLVNDEVRISFYGDFLYPLAMESTLEEYRMEVAEGDITPELIDKRNMIWEALHPYDMRLIRVSPSEFIHFGTTAELLNLMTKGVDDYEFLGWRRQVMTNWIGERQFSINTAFIDESSIIGDCSYIENSILGKGVKVGSGSVISYADIEKCTVPDNTVLHGIEVRRGGIVLRIWGVDDNPKEEYIDGGTILGVRLDGFINSNGLSYADIWQDEDSKSLWNASLYPICENWNEAMYYALIIHDMAMGRATSEQINSWKKSVRLSLAKSFAESSNEFINNRGAIIRNMVVAEKFVRVISQRGIYTGALDVFDPIGIDETLMNMLMDIANSSEYSIAMRIYYALSKYIDSGKYQGEVKSEECIRKCFDIIKDVVYGQAKKNIVSREDNRFYKDIVEVELPVRINWGGGWTDTPPYYLENGGAVLNAAITLRGIYPIQVRVRKLDEYKIELESIDLDSKAIFDDITDIRDCNNPYDHFALHKAGLIACGIIPMEGNDTLEDILVRLGGGIYISTNVVGVPKGSGLGTSSILAGGCAKAIYSILGRELDDDILFETALSMEQIMSTGGGWQDQVGGIIGGIKLITCKSGIGQRIQVEKIRLDESTMKELQDRLALIYTGQRRLARNLLREVVGGYIGGRRESVSSLREIEKMAILMQYSLKKGDIDEFARLLNQHWRLSKQLDAGSTNTCIDQIFTSCDDLIDGRFIAGAGGGGFLHVIKKKGVTNEMLRKRLYSIFGDSGVDVWDCEIVDV